MQLALGATTPKNPDTPEKNPDTCKSANTHEKSKLERLVDMFSKSTSELQAIDEMLKKGHVYNAKAEPRFFDALFFVLEKDWSICKGVFMIHITLKDTPAAYSGNIYPVHTVLNELIARSSLQSLTLRRFGPGLLVASLATLSLMEQLDDVDVSQNQLTLADFDFVLRLLPSNPIDKINVDFTSNCISNAHGVSVLLNACSSKLGNVKLGDQSPQLNIAGIEKAVTKLSFDAQFEAEA